VSILFINPVYGMAGDMLCAALLDLIVEKQRMIAVMQEAARSLGGAAITYQSEVRGESRGLLLNFEYSQREPSRDSDFLLAALQKVCKEQKITGRYREFAEHAFTILKEAEYAAHGRLSSQDHHTGSWQHDHTLHLHEAQDIIVDISGSAWALQELAVQLDRVSCFAPVAIGGGEVSFSHGTFPVPAPATAEIITRYDISVEYGPIDTELFTPTGAALLAALAPVFIDRPSRTPLFPHQINMGVGFGTKRFPVNNDTANALYLYLENEKHG
jgi:uncharacterized protein (DUF111 family)